MVGKKTQHRGGLGLHDPSYGPGGGVFTNPHTRIPLSILEWVAIVLVYYYGFAAPGFVIGQELF